jgi:hypothetical protein
MLYYLLPKIDTTLIVTPRDTAEECPLYISHSLYKYSNAIQTKLKIIQKHNTESAEENEYNFLQQTHAIHSSFNKTDTHSELFYELVEFLIVSNNNYECFITQPTKILYITTRYDDSHNSVEFIKKKYNYTHTNSYTHFNNASDYFKSNNTDKFEFMFFELPVYNFKDVNKYIINVLQIVMIIIKTQCDKGCCLIKINYIYHKPIIDILFLLSSVYSKIYLIKPTLMDTTDYKYVFCKYFNNSPEQSHISNQNYKLLDTFLNKPDLKNITQLIDYDTPAYFIYKINEINLIIGQQQLELCRQLLHIYMGQNQLYKLHQYKQKIIQKLVDWCVKMNIPYNTIDAHPTACEFDINNCISMS